MPIPSPSPTSPLSDILKRLDLARSAHSTPQSSAAPPSPPSGARAQLLYKLESLFEYIVAPNARLPSNFAAIVDALDLLADRRASEEHMRRAERVLDSALAEVSCASAPPPGSVPVMEQSSSSKSSKSSRSTTSSSVVSSSSSSSRRSQRESMPVPSRPAATPVPVPFPATHVSAHRPVSTPHVPQLQQVHRSRRLRATSMIHTSSSASASSSASRRPRRHASVMAADKRVHWADAQAPYSLESPPTGSSTNLALKSPPPRHQDDDWWVLVNSPTGPQPSSFHHTENRSSRHAERDRRGSEHRERRRSSSRPRPLQDVRNHEDKNARKEHSPSPEKRTSSAEKRRREISPEQKSSKRKQEVRVAPVVQPESPPQAFHPARAAAWPARPDYASLPGFARFYQPFPVAPSNMGH